MIWVKIKKILDDDDSIYLPENLIEKAAHKVKLQFATREMKAYLYTLSPSGEEYENTFYNPVVIECSTSVIDRLLIKEDLVYQMLYKDGTISLGPVIGLLLGGQQFYYHNSNMSAMTRSMNVYPKIGGLFVSFKDESIDWDLMQIRGLYFDYETKHWNYGVFPIPSAVYRRAFQTSQLVIDRLKSLTDNKVFNSIRFDKWDMHNMLKKDKHFNQYLPETLELDDTSLFYMFINKYNNIIIKPKGLSRGRGICFIHRMEDLLGVYDYRLSENPRFYTIKEDDVDDFLNDNNLINTGYVVQPQLELATINGAPFDIRIVMEKDKDRVWFCKGIECRLAGPKNLITNISRGGQALSINNAIKLAFGPTVNYKGIREKVISIGKEFCSIMDRTEGHFAEFGLDLAIDTNQKYWFIEANVRPAFKGFRTLDYKNYLHIIGAPLFYAASLSGFGREIIK